MEALKPVGQKERKRLKNARLGQLESSHALIWKALRELSPIGSIDLARETGLTNIRVSYYLSFLERAGYVWLQVNTKPRHYWLIRNTGQEAPQRLRRGQAVFDPNTDETYEVPASIDRWPGEPALVGSPEHRIWQAMRMLRNFTVSELATVTEQKNSVVQEQVNNLMRFDFLRQTEPSFGEPSYLLPKYRDTGDKPPAINTQLGKLYDFKTREIISIQG